MIEKNERTKEQIRRRDEKRKNTIQSALDYRQSVVVERSQAMHNERTTTHSVVRGKGTQRLKVKKQLSSSMR